MTSLILKYRTRLPNNDHPANTWPNYQRAVQADGRQAIRILRKQAKKLGLQPNKIGICGFSAGGHLALNCSLHAEPKLPETEFSGMPDFAGLFYPGMPDDVGQVLESRTTPKSATPGICPFFIVNARDDQLTSADKCVKFYAMLLRAEGKAELHVLSNCRRSLRKKIGPESSTIGRKGVEGTMFSELWRVRLFRPRLILIPAALALACHLSQATAALGPRTPPKEPSSAQAVQPTATAPRPIVAGDSRSLPEECNAWGHIVVGHKATVIQTHPSLSPGSLFSASGRFAKKPVDAPCDPGKALGPFPVSAGGKLVAHLSGSPPAPNALSLGNWGTGLRIVFEPDLGGGNFGPAQDVVSFAIPAKETEAEMEGEWPGPGRLRAYTSPPRGNGPLTTRCYGQSYTAKVEIIEVAASSPAQPGMTLHNGDRIVTDPAGGTVLTAGSVIKIGSDSEVEFGLLGPPNQIAGSPWDFGGIDAKILKKLSEFKEAGYPLPDHMDLGAYNSTVLEGAYRRIQAIKDPCEAAVDLKLVLDANRSRFTAKRIKNLGVDLAGIWLMPNKWNVLDEWGKLLFRNVPLFGYAANAKNVRDTWKRVKQEWVPTVAEQKSGWTLAAYERYKQKSWSEEQIVAEQKHLQQESDGRRAEIGMLQSHFDKEAQRRKKALDSQIKQVRAELAARKKQIAEKALIEEKKLEQALASLPAPANDHHKIEGRTSLAEQRRAEFWRNIMGQYAAQELGAAHEESKLLLAYKLQMQRLAKKYEREVTQRLTEIARLQTEREALETYAKPLAKNDCPGIKPPKAAPEPDPCSGKKAIVMGLKKGTVKISKKLLEKRYGPVGGAFGKAVAQTITVKLDKIKHWIWPNGTEYSVKKQGETATVRVYDGEVKIRSERGMALTVKAGHQAILPAGTVSEFDRTADKGVLVEGLAAQDLPLDSDIPEPYGDVEFSDAENKLPTGWVWQEPNKYLNGPGNATWELLNGNTLRITVPDENDLWGRRSDAPRLLHKVTGDFDLEAEMLLQCKGTDLAASQFVLFTPHTPLGYLRNQMNAEGLGAHYFIVGGGRSIGRGLNKLDVVNRKPAEWPDAPKTPIRARLSRRGKQVKTYWSTDGGKTWTLGSRTVLLLPETFWVGWSFKRMAYDGLHDEPVVTTLRDIHLTTAPLETMPQIDWDVVGYQGTVIPLGTEILMAQDGSKPSSVQLYSPWSIAGNFDLIVRYDAPPLKLQPGQERYIHMAVTTNDEKNHAYVRNAQTPDWHRSDSDMRIDGGWYRYHQLDTQESSGRVRLMRQDGVFSSFVWKDDDWAAVADWKEGFTEPVYLDFRFQWKTPTPVLQTVTFTIERLETSEGVLIGADRTSGVSSSFSPISGPAALGVTIHDAGDAAAQSLDVTASSGAVITHVEPQSPADKGGLKPGDVVVSCNGLVIQTAQDLVATLKDATPGMKLALDVHRGRQALRLDITWGSKPSSSASSPSFPASPASPAPTTPGPPAPAGNAVQSVFGRHERPPLIGIWVTSAGTEQAHKLGIETPSGAVVTNVQEGSLAWQAGLRKGDVIIQWGNREISNYEDLECAMLSDPVGARQSVSFARGSTGLTVSLTIGVGPAKRRTYVDYHHPTGGYSLRLPASWKIVKTKQTPQADINAHDLLVSKDGNYRLFCYLARKPAPNSNATLADFESIAQRDLGPQVHVSSLKGLPLPASMAGRPYQADRKVVLYRIAFVTQNNMYAIDALAPVLSNPKELTDVLRTILGTLNMK